MFPTVTTSLLILLVVTVVVARKAKLHHVKAHARNPLQIVGGQAAKPGEFPYQISMRYKDSHRCGGSIIGPVWVITAYHCVEGLTAKDMIIIAGEILLSNPGSIYTVAEIIPHEDHDLDKLQNDIALLRLSKNIEFSDKVKSIPFEGQGVLDGKKAVASGWGLIRYARPLIHQDTNELQFLDNMVVLSHADCKAKASSPEMINNGSLCAYYGPGKGMCMGDSGGPLAVAGVLCGVVSWGVPCGRGFPDVFMRVALFSGWIRRKMNAV